jgi:hypothetical protein
VCITITGKADSSLNNFNWHQLCFVLPLFSHINNITLYKKGKRQFYSTRFELMVVISSYDNAGGGNKGEGQTENAKV